MSKIICDVCGTSYPDTATQCPICGCVRTADSKSVSARTDTGSGAGGYTYVKGGRFSKSNVRKRNKASGVVSVNAVNTGRGTSKEKDSDSNRGLIATVIILLLAIVAAVLYITIRFFVPGIMMQEQEPPVQTQPTETTLETVPCEDIKLDIAEVVLDKVGDTHVITAITEPVDVTDEIEFVSADETVATVKASGSQATITAVAQGKTMIIVKCGDFKASCMVECVPEGSEDETTESTGEPIPEGAVLELNRSDMTLSRVGETWDLKKGDIPASAITWTSENPNIVSVENGVVKAVGSGMTTIHAECNGQKVSCIVRCNFSSGSTSVPGSGGAISEDG